MNHLDRLPMRVYKKDPPGGRSAARAVRGAIMTAYPDMLRRLSNAKHATTSATHRAAIEKALALLLEARRALAVVDDEITEVLR